MVPHQKNKGTDEIQYTKFSELTEDSEENKREYVNAPKTKEEYTSYIDTSKKNNNSTPKQLYNSAPTNY